MRLGINATFLARRLILAWAIIWFTTVPLFHTHLPATDSLGAHGGVAHTVFSPDLPGEFFHLSTAHHGPLSHLSNWTSNSPEFGFVYSAWQTGTPDILDGGSFLDRPFLSKSVVDSNTVHRTTLVFSISRSPRAPPSAISS